MSRRWLIAVSAAAHLTVGASVFLSGAWRIERLDGERRTIHLGVMLPPPAASGGPVAPDKPKFKPKEDVKVIVKERTQPVPKRPDDPPATITSDLPPGNGSGDPLSNDKCLENCDKTAQPVAPVCGNDSREDGEQCDDGNVSNGDGCSSTCRTEAPPKPKQVMVTQKALQALRLSGDTQPRPSAGTQQMMMRDDTRRVIGTVKLCLGTDGSVVSATTLGTTKYPEYDQAILAAVGTWRYRPYMVNDTPVPVCSTVTFVYTMQ